ncbi:MAG: SixA phosphatase family protein, partial [Rhodospirillales bacterium]
MKRRIYLFRHGKSSWNRPGREDRERDLNARGRAAAERMGRWCAANGVVPDLVLCSTATRAR